MRTTWTFHAAGQIVFGQNAAAKVGEIARRHGGRKALLITDSNLVRAGVVDRVLAPLRDAGVETSVFDGGEPEPSFAACLACEEMARREAPDVLVALGGGSNMDLAKTVAILLTHGGRPQDYVGDGKVPGPVMPVLAVPTTAGTGSEVSGSSVMTDTERKVKVGILDNWMRPTAAIVDPLLTLSCPPKVTADSGIDALTHAIEAATAVDNAEFPLPPGEFTIYQGRHPYGELLAEKAIRLVGQFLARAVRNGDDLEAREGMHLAALFAGLAFSNIGVAAVHALEYPLGGAVHVSHGAGNGLLLPYVMEFNRPARVETFARIAEWLGVDTRGLSQDEAADAAIQHVRDLRREIGIPDRLRELGVREEQLPEFARLSSGITRILRVNPRYPTQAELEGILRAAY